MPYTVVVVCMLVACAVLVSPDGYSAHTKSILHPGRCMGMSWQSSERKPCSLGGYPLSRRHVRSLSSGWSGSKLDPGPLKRAIGNNIRFKSLARPISSQQPAGTIVIDPLHHYHGSSRSNQVNELGRFFRMQAPAVYRARILHMDMSVGLDNGPRRLARDGFEGYRFRTRYHSITPASE